MNTRRLACLRYILSSTHSSRKWNHAALENRLMEHCFYSSTNVVQEVSKKVKQYGKLIIDVPWDVEIKSTDPHEYPDMDTLLVVLSSSKKGSTEQNCDYLSIDVTNDVCTITENQENSMENADDIHCIIEAPIQYDVDVRTTADANIKISNMVSDNINVETERGQITGAKLQGKKIIFYSSQGGSIDLKQSLQGDIDIRTSKNGSIKAEKCLGTKLKVKTENGDLSLGSNYCEKATFESTNGNLTLNNLHMDAAVDISGKGFLNVSCLDGSLQAKLRNGETKVQLVRLTGKSRIISEGPVHLIVPKENNVQFNLKGNSLSFDKGFDPSQPPSDNSQVYISSGDIPLHVETSGTLRVTSSSWAESLQLRKSVK